MANTAQNPQENLETNCSPCAHCGTITKNKELIQTGDCKYICRACMDSDYYSVCECCDELYSVDKLETLAKGIQICGSCCLNEFERCTTCNRLIHVDDVWEWVDDKPYCYHCTTQKNSK